MTGRRPALTRPAVKRIEIVRFDASAKKGGEASFTDASCLQLFSVMLDAKDNALLVVRDGANDLQGRWIDAAGPLTGWFKLGELAAGALPGKAVVLTRPLIGGGAALRINGKWTASIPSGKAEVDAAPKSFEDGKDALIVREGKAYAMVPEFGGTGGLDVVEPGGTNCGAETTATADDEFHIGRDGTLLDRNQCTATYWPQALAGH